MKLFTIGTDFQVELNQEWIFLIPELAAVIKADKGSKGDYRGDKKLKARKIFTFIYFDLDFTSPIREWDEFERRQEALIYAGLEESDLDAVVMAAYEKYDELLLKGSRSLKTLRAVEKSMDQLDNYFNTINFSERDRKGEMVHSPQSHLKNIEGLGKAYDALDKFRRRVHDELKGGDSIRGAATLGLNEGKRNAEWQESRGEPEATDAAEETADLPQQQPKTVQPSFMAIADMLKTTKTYDRIHSKDTEEEEQEEEL